ncbi:MAG: GntR family transcriptional regulator [Candidatus Methanomethylophilaceae archaeon]|jgi:GntR family transcriptional regulator|nr:GntR family transcriptional regulator [Candidatus Methanomethylophilaceae archaeon]
MDIVVSNSDPRPIYEQIYSQIRSQIINGVLKEGELLPSMRVLAKDLRISVITTKRAYNDLEAEGLITTVGGKGCYVSSVEPSVIREGHLVSIQESIRKAADEARENGISREELHEIVDLMYDGD